MTHLLWLKIQQHRLAAGIEGRKLGQRKGREGGREKERMEGREWMGELTP